jgi:hypothetical protein
MTGCNEGRLVEVRYDVEFIVRNIEVRVSQKKWDNEPDSMTA